MRKQDSPLLLWRTLLFGACLQIVPLVVAAASEPASSPTVDIRTFVQRMYYHGTPYGEARAYGSAAVPQLIEMLNDPRMEEHWVKTIYILGCIGDPSAVPELTRFLKRQHGEISVQTFRATLAVLPALGFIAQGGDPDAIAQVLAYANPNHWVVSGLNFGYGPYHGSALGEVLTRTAIQGLGASGRAEALTMLREMDVDPALRTDWRDNVDEALRLNLQVSAEGAFRVFGEEERK